MPAEPAAVAVPEIEAPAVASRGWRLPMFPVGVIGLFLLLALVAPLLSLADPHEQSLRNRFTPPVCVRRMVGIETLTVMLTLPREGCRSPRRRSPAPP